MTISRDITTRTYKYDDQYMIDIVIDGKTYEAWLYNKDYGVKDLMFGSPIGQESFSDFMESVEVNAPDYIATYQQFHEQDDLVLKGEQS